MKARTRPKAGKKERKQQKPHGCRGQLVVPCPPAVSLSPRGCGMALGGPLAGTNTVASTTQSDMEPRANSNHGEDTGLCPLDLKPQVLSCWCGSDTTLGIKGQRYPSCLLHRNSHTRALRLTQKYLKNKAVNTVNFCGKLDRSDPDEVENYLH